MFQRPHWKLAVIAWIALIVSFPIQTQGQDDPLVKEIGELSKRFADAFNSGKIDDIPPLFVEQCELIDENGTVYQGREEVKALVAEFLKKYEGVQIGMEVESIRRVGPFAVKEGVRTMATKDGQNISRMRFITTYAKGDAGWQIASIRDFGDEVQLTPHELLQPLNWLIGDWVNEGADARVKISYRWSDDTNYILGNFHVTGTDGVESHSVQRIGWDPRSNKPHSWLFDADGGFGEGTWTAVDNGWLVNSSAVMPDGLTGSATIKLTPGENGRFTIAGTNRVVGDQLEEDFELIIVKQPPASGK